MASIYTPTQDERELVKRMVRAGLPDQKIAECLDTTTAKLRKNFPTELQAAPEAVAEVADALYRAALEGNVPAMKFFLACRGGFIEKAAEQEIAAKAQPLIVKLAPVEPPA